MMEGKNNTDSEVDLGRGFRRKQIIHTAKNNGMKTFQVDLFLSSRIFEFYIIIIFIDICSDSSILEETSDNDSIPDIDKTLHAQGMKYSKISTLLIIFNLKKMIKLNKKNINFQKKRTVQTLISIIILVGTYMISLITYLSYKVQKVILCL